MQTIHPTKALIYKFPLLISGFWLQPNNVPRIIHPEDQVIAVDKEFANKVILSPKCGKFKQVI